MEDFLRSYIQTLSIPRVTIFLTLLLKAIRERVIGSPGALCAILSAFDLGDAKLPAMGADALLELKDMLLAVLPPLNQVLYSMRITTTVRPVTHPSGGLFSTPRTLRVF